MRAVWLTVLSGIFVGGCGLGICCIDSETLRLYLYLVLITFTAIVVAPAVVWLAYREGELRGELRSAETATEDAVAFIRAAHAQQTAPAPAHATD